MIAWQLLIGLVAVCLTTLAAALILRQRSAPTATLLSGVAACLALVAGSQFAIVPPSFVRSAVVPLSGIDRPETVWLAVTVGLTFPADALWFLFCVRYTGRGRRLWPQAVAVVVAVVGFFYAASAYVALWTPADRPVTEAIAPVLASGSFLLSSLATFGSVLVLETAIRRNAVPVREGVTLAVGASLFVYAPAFAFTLGQPTLVPACLIGASALLVVVVDRFPLFEVLPTARITARDRLIDEMGDAVALVDERARVVELNAAARSLFDADATRRPLRAIVPELPDPADLVAAAGPFRLRLDDRRLEIDASRVAGERGATVGYLVVCRDVTERQQRERRLRVLTRFLAGTVGERAETVARRADRMTAGDRPVALAREVRRTTASLKRCVAAARSLERALSDPDPTACDVRDVLRAVTDDRERAELADDADATALVDPEVLRSVLTLLLETRLESTAAAVRIDVRPETGSLVVELSGPTADEGDLAPMSTTESPPEGDTQPAEGDPQPAEGDPAGDAGDPTIALCRVALERVDGSLDRSPGGGLVVRLDAADRRMAAPEGRE